MWCRPQSFGLGCANENMRLEQFLFCEYAHAEMGGIATLVGVIPGNSINVTGSQAGQPIRLTSFACFSVFSYMENVPEILMQCEVLRGSEVIARLPPLPYRRDNPAAHFHSHVFSFSPLVLPGSGEYQFRVTMAAGGRIVSFPRKLIVQAPGGTATGTRH